MNKLLFLGLWLTASLSFAGEQYRQPVLNLQQSVKINTEAESYATSSANANSGDASVRIVNDAAASSTVTGSSNTTAECWRYDSTSGSFIFAGLTKTLMVRDLVCTLGKPLNNEQKIVLCLENADYRKLRDIMHASDASIVSCTK